MMKFGLSLTLVPVLAPWKVIGTLTEVKSLFLKVLLISLAKIRKRCPTRFIFLQNLSVAVTITFSGLGSVIYLIGCIFLQKPEAIVKLSEKQEKLLKKSNEKGPRPQ